MIIKRYYLTKSDNTRRGEKLNSVKNIVLTSSKYLGFNAIKNRNVIEMSKYKEDKEFSCNYIIGTDGRIVCIIPEGERAICTRVEDIDINSISIMLCIDEKGKYSSAELKSLKSLIDDLIKKYDLKFDDILLEYDVNGSRRPQGIVDEPIILRDLMDKKMTRIIL